MKTSALLFVPNTGEVEYVRTHVDLMALTTSELMDQVWFGGFLFLEAAPHRKYLFIERADPLGFVGNLQLRLADARREGCARLTSPDQLYDLEIRAEAKSNTVRDLARPDEPVIQMAGAEFVTNLDRCAGEVLQFMLLMFPQLASRKDMDQIRRALSPRSR